MLSNNYLPNVVAEMSNILDRYGWYNSTEFALTDIVVENMSNKAGLYDLLSAHPDWNAEEGRIVIEDNIIRPFSVCAVRYFFDRVSALNRKHKVISQDKMERLGWIFHDADSQYLKNCSDKCIADRLNVTNENYRIRPEMKVSKVISKVMRVEGLDQMEGYGKLFSSLADDTNPKKIKKHVIISVNPADFLMMSNGDSWSSCHEIDNEYDDPGIHCAGTISYALDKHSFLFYTVNLSYEGDDYEWEEREEREVFAYNGDFLFQSRLYPQSCDFGADEVYTNNREIVQRVIDECLKAKEDARQSEAWNCDDKYDEVNDFVYLGDDAQCYPDWEYFSCGSEHCRISFKGNRHPNMPMIQLGKKARCVACGEEHTINNKLVCCDNAVVCEHCGHRVKEEDAFWFDDEGWLCSDCVVKCTCCSKVYPKYRNECRGYDVKYFKTYDEYIVCHDCWSGNADIMYITDLRDYVYIYEKDYTEINGEYYSNANKGIIWDYCDWCGMPFLLEDLKATWDGEQVCEDCYHFVNEKEVVDGEEE